MNENHDFSKISLSVNSEPQISLSGKKGLPSDSHGDFTGNLWEKFLPFVSFRNIFWGFAWILFSAILLYFSLNIVEAYFEKYPITVITYVEPNEQPAPLVISVCNNIFLDPQKILDFNESESSTFKKEAFEFLHQAAIGNDSFDDTSWVVPNPSRDYFMLSARVADFFKLDSEKFMINCILMKNYTDCRSFFRWDTEEYGYCYQATIDLGGYGEYRSLLIGLYFDPNITLGRYTLNMGARISVSHPNDNTGTGETFFLEPQENADVLVSVEHKSQSHSLDKATCTEEDLQWYTFTGKPFQSAYNPWVCSTFCLAKLHYKYCNCSSIMGYNVTNTECIEKSEHRKCLFDIAYQMDELMKESKPCTSKCHPKCNRSSYKLEVKKENYKRSPKSLTKLLNQLKAMNETDTPLVDQLIKKTESGENTSEYIGHVSIRLRSFEPEKKVEIIRFMTFSTAMSNIGGLIGAWLGLSAISVVHLIEQVAIWSIKKKPKEVEKPDSLYCANSL